MWREGEGCKKKHHHGLNVVPWSEDIRGPATEDEFATDVWEGIALVSGC